MTKHSMPVYYFQAISPEADRRLVVRCYGRQHDVIVGVLIDKEFNIEAISEEKFNTIERLINSGSILDTTAHNVPAETLPDDIERTLRKKI